MVESPCVGPAFTFKQLLHTLWSLRRRKPRLSKFTKAHWAHRHTGNGKRFHRHGHMTRAGSVDGSGENRGEGLKWCVSTARLAYSSMRHTKPTLFILYSSCELLLQMLSVVCPCARPAFWLAAVVTMYSRYLDSWKLREGPEPLKLLLQRWSHCSAQCSHKQHLFSANTLPILQFHSVTSIESLPDSHNCPTTFSSSNSSHWMTTCSHTSHCQTGAFVMRYSESFTSPVSANNAVVDWWRLPRGL